MEWRHPSPVRRLTDTLSPGRGLSFLVRVEVRKTALSLGERVARCPDALHREAGRVRG